MLAKTIEKLGGRPVAAKARDQFPTEGLKSEADVLRFAASLEKGAVSAYLGAVPASAIATSRRRRRASSATRRCTGRCCGTRSARRPCPRRSCRDSRRRPPDPRGGGRGRAGRVRDAAGDAARGEAIYSRCFACHSLDADRTGPRHCGLLGGGGGERRRSGFDYSPAMRASGIVWDAKSLDWFLASPAAVPGTSMGYAGIASAQERADLVAFLGAARCSGPRE